MHEYLRCTVPPPSLVIVHLTQINIIFNLLEDIHLSVNWHTNFWLLRRRSISDAHNFIEAKKFCNF